MSLPKNPETIILKNIYYPNGLKEIDVYNYYKQNNVKTSIMNQLKNRNVVLFLILDNEEIIVKRNNKDKNPIIINNSNDYDNIITGRTLTLLSTIKQIDDTCLIDIDCNDFELSKEIVKISYKLLNNNMNHLIENKEIRYTGKNSFHIFCKLQKKFNIDSIKKILELMFKKNNSDYKYTVSHQRHGNKPNIDLYTNVNNSAFICLNSLSMIGLKCMKVELKNLNNFKKEMAII